MERPNLLQLIFKSLKLSLEVTYINFEDYLILNFILISWKLNFPLWLKPLYLILLREIQPELEKLYSYGILCLNQVLILSSLSVGRSDAGRG